MRLVDCDSTIVTHGAKMVGKELGRLFLGLADDNGITTVILGDSTGRVLAENKGESVNYIRVGMGKARENLRSLVQQTLGSDRQPQVDTVCFAYQSDLIQRIDDITRLMNGVVHASNVELSSFQKAALLGLPPYFDSQMMVLSGNVGCVVGRDPTGVLLQVGYSQPSLHGGGAADVTLHALRMIREIPCAFGVQELKDALLHLATTPNCSKLRAFAMYVDDLAEQGNPAALDIMYDAAAALINHAIRMIRYIGVSDPVIGLHGSVMLGSAIVHERFRRIISSLFPGSQVRSASQAPAKGAYLSCLKARNLIMTDNVIENAFSASQ